VLCGIAITERSFWGNVKRINHFVQNIRKDR
jgi:hypothetical protein